MIDITQPLMRLMRDGVEISRHTSAVEAMERAGNEGPGRYTLVRPDAAIVVDGEADETPEVPEPDPVPEPEPEQPDPVEPDPEPEPEPDPSTKPAAIHKAVNEAALVNFDHWNRSSRYTRALKLDVWTRDVETVTFDRQDLTTTGGGGRRPF